MKRCSRPISRWVFIWLQDIAEDSSSGKHCKRSRREASWVSEIPLVEYDKEASEGTPNYAFYSTRVSLDEAQKAFNRVKELTIKLSTIETSAIRLATNIKKTQKRANALKNITIPTYEAIVKNITNALEEKEREEFTRLKVIKERIS